MVVKLLLPPVKNVELHRKIARENVVCSIQEFVFVRNNEIYLNRLTPPPAMPVHVGVDSLKISHHIANL